MKKVMKILPLVLVAAASLVSCSQQVSATIEISTPNTEETRVITPENLVVTETLSTIESKLYFNQQFLPSTGNVNILVIPTLIPNYEKIDFDNDGNDDKDKVKKDIETAFNGTQNLVNESVASFYKKSSFDKLNLTATVTDWFKISDANIGITNGASIETSDTPRIVEAAVKWAKESQYIDLTKFDNDQDGFIDGVWLIYSANNYHNGGPQTNTDNYFAYTSWGNLDADPEIENPVYGVYGWASYDFMYRNANFDKIDTHTYVHEMGHFLGLNDYYSDNYSYNPIGKIDLMDGNIIDLNNYSKMLLGWTKPYLVTGNASISLKSMQNLNNFIVIPGDSYQQDGNNFDPFSEYILVELYSPNGLNEFASNNFVGSSPKAPKTNGVRIYHIDNRKFIVNTTDEYNVFSKEYEGEKLNENVSLILPISNNRGPDVYSTMLGLPSEYNLFDEIRFIEANNKDTFSNGGYQIEKSFFKENDVFSMDKYGENFFVFNKLNNQDTFSYEIKVGGVK